MSGTSFKSAREAAAHALQLTKSLARTDEPPTDRELDELYRATGEACQMAEAMESPDPAVLQLMLETTAAYAKWMARRQARATRRRARKEARLAVAVAESILHGKS